MRPDPSRRPPRSSAPRDATARRGCRSALLARDQGHGLIAVHALKLLANQPGPLRIVLRWIVMLWLHPVVGAVGVPMLQLKREDEGLARSEERRVGKECRSRGSE